MNVLNMEGRFDVHASKPESDEITAIDNSASNYIYHTNKKEVKKASRKEYLNRNQIIVVDPKSCFCTIWHDRLP